VAKRQGFAKNAAKFWIRKSKMTTTILKEKYSKEIVPALMKKFEIKNIMRVPKVQKIVINVCVGKAASENNIKLLDMAVEELTMISGQKPAITRSKKAISNFKLRANQPLGAKVTLRGARMFQFMERLFMVTFPRIRDFRGVPTRSFDGRGNYTLGLKEQIIFPEINFENVQSIHGMDITFTTNAENDEQAKELLKLLGMPFRNN
jgi:large subunit ribosomal protein L5